LRRGPLIDERPVSIWVGVTSPIGHEGLRAPFRSPPQFLLPECAKQTKGERELALGRSERAALRSSPRMVVRVSARTAEAVIACSRLVAPSSGKILKAGLLMVTKLVTTRHSLRRPSSEHCGQRGAMRDRDRPLSPANATHQSFASGSPDAPSARGCGKTARIPSSRPIAWFARAISASSSVPSESGGDGGRSRGTYV